VVKKNHKKHTILWGTIGEIRNGELALKVKNLEDTRKGHSLFDLV
jgi:hypothetical protein